MSWLFSLKSIFPEFPWVQVADDWLALAHQKSIEQQLEERGIKKVRFWYNIAAGYITVKVFCSPFEELAKEGDALCQSVERFCDEFAARWTHMNSLSKFRQFFSKNKNTDLLSVKHDIYNRAE